MMIFAETSVPSEVYLTESVNIYWTPYSSVYGVFVPLLLLAVTWIRKERRKASF
jgi:spore germination protein KB